MTIKWVASATTTPSQCLLWARPDDASLVNNVSNPREYLHIAAEATTSTVYEVPLYTQSDTCTRSKVVTTKFRGFIPSGSPRHGESPLCTPKVGYHLLPVGSVPGIAIGTYNLGDSHGSDFSSSTYLHLDGADSTGTSEYLYGFGLNSMLNGRYVDGSTPVHNEIVNPFVGWLADQPAKLTPQPPEGSTTVGSPFPLSPEILLGGNFTTYSTPRDATDEIDLKNYTIAGGWSNVTDVLTGEAYDQANFAMQLIPLPNINYVSADMYAISETEVALVARIVLGVPDECENHPNYFKCYEIRGALNHRFHVAGGGQVTKSSCVVGEPKTVIDQDKFRKRIEYPITLTAIASSNVFNGMDSFKVTLDIPISGQLANETVITGEPVYTNNGTDSVSRNASGSGGIYTMTLGVPSSYGSIKPIAENTSFIWARTA